MIATPHDFDADVKALDLRAGRGLAFASSSEEATAAFAAWLGRELPHGAVVALSGPLGAGKTAFVRGLARGLGVDATIPVTSPTYALVAEHGLADGDVFHHADLYRLGEDAGELEALGFRDWLAESRCIAMEWAELVPEALATAHLRIVIDDVGATERMIRVSPGPAFGSLVFD